MIGSINRAISTCLKEMLLFGLQSSFLKPLSSGICQCARGKRVFAWWSLDFLHKTRGNIYICVVADQKTTTDAKRWKPVFFSGVKLKNLNWKNKSGFWNFATSKNNSSSCLPFFSHHGCWKSWPSTLLWCKAVSTWIVPTFTPYFVRITCNLQYWQLDFETWKMYHGKCRWLQPYIHSRQAWFHSRRITHTASTLAPARHVEGYRATCTIGWTAGDCYIWKFYSTWWWWMASQNRGNCERQSLEKFKKQV